MNFFSLLWGVEENDEIRFEILQSNLDSVDENKDKWTLTTY